VPQPRCAMASERWCYAARPAELTSSKTAPATLRRLQSSIHHLLRRSAHHSSAPPSNRHRRPPPAGTVWAVAVYGDLTGPRLG
jgi:hypothetical protein